MGKNKWNPKPKFVLAKDGWYTDAVIVETKYEGVKPTKYGNKDFQQIVVQITQTGDDGKPQKAKAYIFPHRSLDSRSTLVRLLKALKVSATVGQEFDFDDLVGKKFLSIRVYHEKAKGGSMAKFTPEYPPSSLVVKASVFAEPVEPIEPEKPEPEIDPEPAYRGVCEVGDCTNERETEDSPYCPRHAQERMRGCCTYGRFGECSDEQAEDSSFCLRHQVQI